MKFSFIYSGRFGNNIIQYIAAELLAYKYNGIVTTQNEGIKIDDNRWVELMEKDNIILEDNNYLLDGYFQRGDIFLKYKDCILSLINSNFPLYNNLPFKNIFTNIDNIDQNTVVVHLRLDDFNFQDGKSNVVIPSFYINEIKKSNKSNVLIVVDKLRYNQEKKYVGLIIKECKDLSIKIQQGSLLQDWNTIRCSNYVISSNSSFSWIASFFGSLLNKNSTFIFPHTGFYQSQLFNINTDNFYSYNVDTVNFMSI